MTKRIAKKFIEELTARTDLVGLIHSYIPLKKKSGRYWACCPFHEEKTPSFTINVEKGFYHCFGCKASGDALRFLMDYKNLDFVEAVEILADFNNESIVYEENFIFTHEKPRAQIDLGLHALQDACDWFKKQLFDKNIGINARAYLRKRCLKMRTIEHFQLGFAPRNGGLVQFLQQKYPLQILLETGLARKNERGIHDYFWGRIMFPIQNFKGQIIGFGARSLEDEQPKYLNSPETNWFNKRYELYGLNFATQNRTKELIVTEGYMDVIKLWQFGISNAIAALGTAFGETHIQQLKKRCELAYFSFDGDQAGEKAATRALEVLFAQHDNHHQWRFVFMPASEDPDSLIQKKGIEAFQCALQSSLTPSQFLCKLLDDGLGNARSVEAKEQIIRKLQEWLRNIPHHAAHYRELLQNEIMQRFQLSVITPPVNITKFRKTEFTPHPKIVRSITVLDMQLCAHLIAAPEISYHLKMWQYPVEFAEKFPIFWRLVSAFQQSENLAASIQFWINHFDLTEKIKSRLQISRQSTAEELLESINLTLAQHAQHIDKRNALEKT